MSNQRRASALIPTLGKPLLGAMRPGQGALPYSDAVRARDFDTLDGNLDSLFVIQRSSTVVHNLSHLPQHVPLRDDPQSTE